MKPRWHLGTMGFGYKDWHGPFYPTHLPTRNQLKHYARYFDAVEIDSTFYGTPRESTVARWRDITPAEFRFCLKVPSKITHELRLGGERAISMAQEFLERAAILGSKLGVVLFQFPPSYGRDDLALFEGFFNRLKWSARLAVEFRNTSWYVDETANLLSALQLAWAYTDVPDLPVPQRQTTSHVYVRWIGEHGRFNKHTRERLDLTEELHAWKKRFGRALAPDSHVYGFFNNDYSGFAPETCNRFKSMLGLPTIKLEPPRQKRLL